MPRKPEVSAGLLVFRRKNDKPEVLLAHPGGPFWSAKDLGAWTIPKGLAEIDRDLLAAAQREFNEETGFVAQGPFIALSPVKQSSGKVVHAWACAGDFDPAKMVSNHFELEWPPKSGRRQSFPEVDRLAWFGFATALKKILAYQRPLVLELRRLLANDQ